MSGILTGTSCGLPVGSILLVNQDFEGTGTPSGWAGTGDFDNAVSPLQGAQSLVLVLSQTASISDGGVLNNSELYFKFLFRSNTLPVSSNEFFYAMDGAGTRQIRIISNADGTVRVQDRLGNIFATTVASMSLATTYYVWVYNKKGSGTNQICSVAFNTTDSRPTSGNNFAGGTSGTETGNVTQCFWAAGDSSVLKVDVVQISATLF